MFDICGGSKMDGYKKVRDEKENGVTIITLKADTQNKYFNQDDKDGGGDFIYIDAPSSELVDETNKSDNGESINDALHALLYAALQAGEFCYRVMPMIKHGSM